MPTSTTITDAPALHPGEMLLEEFLNPSGLSQAALAKGAGLSPSLVNMIIKGTASISADTAIRLGKFFGTSFQLWLNLQNEYDVRVAQHLSGAKFDKIHVFEPIQQAEAITSAEVEAKTGLKPGEARRRLKVATARFSGTAAATAPERSSHHDTSNRESRKLKGPRATSAARSLAGALSK